jgi:3-deoxy-D-manno-octulosonate 8-phosphate phosphatase (KDO 8-P phosphatase)
MISPTELEARFSRLGGVFLTPLDELVERARSIRGFVFDWDGVFNAGAKAQGAASPFFEADSMGTNLVRYALWRAHGRMPVTAIVTGADNPTAVDFARREHFTAVFGRMLHKAEAADALCAKHEIAPAALACVFDDVNDLAMAAPCGLRFLVRRDASALLGDYVAERGLCDYITAMRGGENAVREVAELFLGLLGSFETVVASRTAWDDDYARYFAARQACETEVSTRGAH